MIISHAHRFIFIKTKKTAGTAIEAALSSICGDDDVITPFRSESEKDRVGREPRNYRIDHPLKPKRPLIKRLLLRPERYWHPSIGYYEHMPAWRVRGYVGERIWRNYFKFAFERNPWDRQVSWYLYKTKPKTPRHETLAVDFLGRYENLEGDLNKALVRAGVEKRVSLARVNVTPDKPDCHFRSYYTPPLRDLVAKWYAREIELLDYQWQA